MFVTVGEEKFRVQFVHSARELKTSRAAEHPGGLRQLVDNLAKSLRRRVSFAEVALVETIKVTKKETAESFVPLGQGYAVCHHTDNFVKKDGRGRALYRALKSFPFPGEVKDVISIAAGFGDFTALKCQYGNAHAPIVRTLPLSTKDYGCMGDPGDENDHDE